MEAAAVRGTNSIRNRSNNSAVVADGSMEIGGGFDDIFDRNSKSAVARDLEIWN